MATYSLHWVLAGLPDRTKAVIEMVRLSHAYSGPVARPGLIRFWTKFAKSKAVPAVSRPLGSYGVKANEGQVPKNCSCGPDRE